MLSSDAHYANCSEEGKGLLTIGISGIAMCPLSSVSERAAEIESSAPASGAAPGLKEQRAEQIARLREGAANAEYVTIPGFYSFPSAWCPTSSICGAS